MSLIMVRDVLKYSPSKGNARLVELVLAEAVNDERVRLGHGARVFLGQHSIARRCNCSRSTVERGLVELGRLQRCFDTGEREMGRYRGTTVYELAAPHLDDPYVLDGKGSPDLPDSGASDADLPQNGASENDLPHSAADLPHPERDLPHPAVPLASPSGHVPEVPAVKPEKTDAPAPARQDAEVVDAEIVYHDGPTDAAVVAAQRDSTSTRDYIASLPPHVQPQSPKQVEADRTAEPEETREEKEALFADCERRLAAGQGSTLTRGTRDRLAAELCVEVAA
jgi:hypothetical protein